MKSNNKDLLHISLSLSSIKLADRCTHSSKMEASTAKESKDSVMVSSDSQRGGGTPSSAASTVTAVGSSGNSSILRSSTRLPTYVDYTALANGKAGHVNDSAHLPTDADDKLKKYYSVTSGSIRGRIIARANATKGWFGAALRAGVRAGFLETRFWLRAALLFLILLGFGVS